MLFSISYEAANIDWAWVENILHILELIYITYADMGAGVCMCSTYADKRAGVCMYSTYADMEADVFSYGNILERM